MSSLVCKVGTYCCFWTSVSLICKTYNFYGMWNLYTIYQTYKAWCLGWGLDRLYNKKDVDFSSFSSADNVLARCGIFSIDDLCDDHEWGNSGEKAEVWDKRDLQPVTSLLKSMLRTELLKSFLCAHSIGSLKNRVFGIWNWCSFIRNIRFCTERFLLKTLLAFSY
jgi:hypothetical protein